MTSSDKPVEGKVAVVLFNLGGPDSLYAVRPFLFNLFYDPAILSVSNPLRWCLARYISSRRAPLARVIYARMGGSSPLLENTEAQASALEEVLAPFGDIRVFIAMRYWHPRAAKTVARVKAFGPDRVVLLPLYPQYSVTTSTSSIQEWRRVAEARGLEAETSTICCYPDLPELIEGFSTAVVPAVQKFITEGHIVRVVVSAHGLPERVIKGGDPYQWQVERSFDALRDSVMEVVGPSERVEWVVAYQSRATPERWLEPDTEVEIRTASRAGKAIVVVPIAFVSEHSETLVELDLEYAAVAKKSGAAGYERIPTIGASAAFIQGLGRLVRESLQTPGRTRSSAGRRICPAGRSGCPLPDAVC